MIALTVAKSDASSNICSVWQHCADVYLVMGFWRTDTHFFVSKEIPVIKHETHYNKVEILAACSSYNEHQD